ncbi:MAG TPA: bifunctional oligoribonuclease/PAP phosphatase NrnA, partial [Candidatus Binatus sp.]|nr:bifunctional oligoribonuclease/PAP phosphatase NrnA [Candidatus Binatus sp.]
MTVDLRPWLDVVPAQTVAALAASRDVLVASHENPDADTIGAGLGIAAIVRAHGGRATLVCSDPVPPLYDFLGGVDTYTTNPEPDRAYDRVVFVDCGTLDRVGTVRERHRALFDRLPRVVIDHHASNGEAGPADWVDPEAAATCELVALLAVRLGVPLEAGDGALATALMAGIVMDTATFAHPNATPRTLAVSAALVAAGAPLSDISRRLYRTKPDEQLRLFGRVLDRLATAAEGRIIYSALLASDLEATGASAAHSEGIIDLLAQSETAEVAILFKEQDAGATRVSVRTKAGGVDATELTGAFGGGGHPRAAGATVQAPLA